MMKSLEVVTEISTTEAPKPNEQPYLHWLKKRMEVNLPNGLILGYFLGRYVEEVMEEKFVSDESWNEFLAVLEDHSEAISKWLPKERIWDWKETLQLCQDDKFIPGVTFPPEIEHFYVSFMNFLDTDCSLEVIDEI